MSVVVVAIVMTGLLSVRSIMPLLLVCPVHPAPATHPVPRSVACASYKLPGRCTPPRKKFSTALPIDSKTNGELLKPLLQYLLTQITGTRKPFRHICPSTVGAT